MTQADTNLSSVLPSSVQVVFRVASLEQFNPPVYAKTIEISDILNPVDEYGQTTSNETITGHPGAKILHDTAAIYEGGDTVEVDDLAHQLAQDFYDFATINHDVVYDGIVVWEIEGLSDCVEFSYDADCVATRILTGPRNNYPEEFLHMACPDSSSGSESDSVPEGCGFYSGSVTRVTDVQCDGTYFHFQSVIETYDCGKLISVTDPEWAQEGCCTCPGSSSSGGSS